MPNQIVPEIARDYWMRLCCSHTEVLPFRSCVVYVDIEAWVCGATVYMCRVYV